MMATEQQVKHPPETECRCWSCNKIIVFLYGGHVAVKCPRCKAYNVFTRS